MVIREIGESEIPQFLRLADYSFGTYRDKEPEAERVERFETTGAPAAIDGSTIASQLYVHEFEQSIRGAIVRMGGIGAVGTVPEYRGSGLVRELLNESFRWMHARGIDVSMLRPFKESYYEKFGYVRTAHSIRIDLPNTSFHEYRTAHSTGPAIERVPAAEAKTKYFGALRSASDLVHGRVVSERISSRNFAERFKDRQALFVSRADEISAMLMYRKEGFLEKGKMTVSDFFWRDRESLLAVFGFFSIHRDQIGTVSMALPFDSNITAMIPRIPGPVTMKFVAAPWMVRIIDVRAVLDGFPIEGTYHDAERVTIEVIDPLCEWNNLVLTLTASEGTVQVEEAEGSPDVTLSISAISAMIYGSFPVSQIESEFPPATATADAVALLDRWFPERTLFNDYDF